MPTVKMETSRISTCCSPTVRTTTRRSDYSALADIVVHGAFPVNIPKSCKTSIVEARAKMDIGKVKKTSIRKEINMDDATHSHDKCNTLEPFFWRAKPQNKKPKEEFEIHASKDSDWVSMIDTKTNRKYYFNVVTRESQWEDPQGYCYHEMREYRDIMNVRDKMTAAQIVQKRLESKGNPSTSFSPPYRSAGRNSNKCTQSMMEGRASNGGKNKPTETSGRSNTDLILNGKVTNDSLNEAPQKTTPCLDKTSVTTPETFQDTKTSSTDSSWLVTKLLAKPAFGERVAELGTTKTQNNEVLANSKKLSVPSRRVVICTPSPEPFKSSKETIVKPKTMNKSSIDKLSDTSSISEDAIISSSESSWLVSKLLEKPNIFSNKIQTAASSCLETNRPGKYSKEKKFGSSRRNAIQKAIHNDVINAEKETVNHPTTPSTCADTASNTSSATYSLASLHPKYTPNNDSNSNSTIFEVATQNCFGPNAKYISTSETWKSQRNYHEGCESNKENWWTSNQASTCKDNASNTTSSTSSLASPYPRYISNRDSNSNSTFFTAADKNFFGTDAKYNPTSETLKSQRNYHEGCESNEENWWSTNQDPSDSTEPSDLLEQHQQNNCSSNRMSSPVIQKNNSQTCVSKWNLARHEVTTRPMPKDLLLTFDSCFKGDSYEALLHQSSTSPPLWDTQLVYQSDNDSEDDSASVSDFSACSQQTNVSTTAITTTSWKTKPQQQEGMPCNTIEPPSRLQKYLVKMEDF